MPPLNQTNRWLIPIVLVLVLVLLGATQMALTRTQQQATPTFEELVSWVELLRARQEVLTADVSDFKDDVAEATAVLRAEMTSEVTTVRAEVSAIAVPVGGVIAWWGDLSSIPENFELCDGNPPTTPGAVFSSNKPNLLQRFVRGAVLTVGSTGGQDLIADATTWPHTLTVSEMPSHNHHDGTFKHILKVDGFATLKYSDNTVGEPNLYSSRSMENRGLGQAHSHGISGHDNRPKYYELFYIIRVK